MTFTDKIPNDQMLGPQIYTFDSIVEVKLVKKISNCHLNILLFITREMYIR